MSNRSKRHRRYVYGTPHLLRRRGRNRLWTGWLEGKEVSLRTPDRDEAQRRLDALAQDRRRAEGGGPPAKPPLLAELGMKFAEFCRPPRYTRKTAYSYCQRVVAFVEWAEALDVRRADRVTFSVLRSYMDSRGRKGAKARTINRDYSAIRRLFAFAMSEGLIQKDPFESDDFRKLRLREPRPKPNGVTLAPGQVDVFLDTADQICCPGHAALFRLTAGSGIRIDEARHFNEDDVDSDSGILTITPKDAWTTKGYRYRRIPISQATARAALQFLQHRKDVPLDDKSVWKAVRHAQQQAGLPRFSMHDLRRAWASAMHANGASLKQVSVWLGHADVATTERYIMVFDDISNGHQFLPR